MGLESVTVDGEYDGALAAENGEIRISLLGKIVLLGNFHTRKYRYEKYMTLYLQGVFCGTRSVATRRRW